MSRALGREAEDRAARYLQSQGYTIVTRRFAAIGGEIDLIAFDGNMLVFVEVKHRAHDRPEEALTASKVEHWRRAALEYRRRMEIEEDQPYRFDLVAIEGTELRHWVDVLS